MLTSKYESNLHSKKSKEKINRLKRKYLLLRFYESRSFKII